MLKTEIENLKFNSHEEILLLLTSINISVLSFALGMVALFYKWN